MKIEGLLPIGSVVMLQESNHRVMIMGYGQRLEGNEKIFDYAGCLWPEGYLRPKQVYVFDGSAIAEVFFLGYQSDGQQVFAAKVEESLKRLRGTAE